INEPEKTGQSSKMFEIIKAIQSINIPLVLSTFVFFFIGGYLLYGALFAAVGSAVDNETDTQQFMLPITVPLIIAIVMAQLVLKDPGGSVVFWMSIIPFTSPIIMMMRVPFGVPAFDLILSMILLIAGFIVTTWFAAKIYRVGILMYGKKVNYKEISKWLFYKT
ncbi:MAG: ABC transporter permease, partial [Cytophagales bacterium]|nr:ABC transporter permease [Cytophagales bacterium]